MTQSEFENADGGKITRPILISNNRRPVKKGSRGRSGISAEFSRLPVRKLQGWGTAGWY